MDLYVKDNETIPAVQWSASSVPGHTQATTVTDLNDHGFRNGKDYRFVRNYIKDFVNTGGAPISTLNDPPSTPATNDIHLVDTVPTGAWVGHAGEYAVWDGAAWVFDVDQLDAGVRILSASEQVICCELKIGSQAKRNSIVGAVNAEALGLAYDAKMKPVREIRLGRAKSHLHSELPDDAGTVLDEARGAIVDYILFGREGTVQGDSEGITDYFNSLGSWAPNLGLKDKPWTPINSASMSALVTELEDIMINGNY